MYGQETIARIVAILEDAKGQNVQVFHVREQRALFEYMVITSADSQRHVRALVRHFDQMAKSAGLDVLRIEGLRYLDWVLLDLGEGIVHIMHTPVRAYYDLETLWLERATRLPSTGERCPETQSPL